MATYKAGDVLSGGYRVIDVKRGGMGVVYICHQPPDRYYAVKTVDPATAVTSDPEAIEQFFKYFRDEVDLWIRVSRQARQENIVEALLYNEHEHWLFLEYVDGLSVAEAARRQPLHMQHVLDWSIGVSRGMEVLHTRFNLIHRDLKPQNVLVTQDGLIPKISDMGIAKVLQEDEGENTIIGTKGYRAPETWKGKTDFVSDIYSFGATLYAMVTGAAPKGRDNPFVPSKALDAPSSVNPRVPPELDAIICKCLEEAPNKRYQSFAEITPLLESLGPYRGDPYDEGFHYCEKHGYFSLIRDGKSVCSFCIQDELHKQNLDHASEIEATVAAGLDEPTIPLPSGVAPHGEFTVTAPTGLAATVAEGIPQTIAAPSTPTVSAPQGHASPGGQPAPTRSSHWPMILGLLVVLIGGGGALWYSQKPQKDPFDPNRRETNGEIENTNGSGKDEGPKIDHAKLETGDLVVCQDLDCNGRTFHAKNSRDGAPQVYCWAKHHVECAECGLREKSRAIFQAVQGCVSCGSLEYEELTGEDRDE